MPYGGGAGSGGGGGVILSSNDSAPNDEVGAVGDFHLRRDTGVLTGPKGFGSIASDPVRITDKVPNFGSTDMNAPRVALALHAELNFLAYGIKWYHGGNQGGDTVVYHLLDSGRNIIATTAQGLRVEGAAVTLAFPEAFQIVAGTTYWIGCHSIAENVLSHIDGDGGNLYPDAEASNPGGNISMAWWSGQANYTGAPNDQKATLFAMGELISSEERETWTGMDQYQLTSV